MTGRRAAWTPQGTMLLLPIVLLTLAGCGADQVTTATMKSPNHLAHSVLTAGCSALSLVSAINTANNNDGPDVIELDSACTYSLTVSRASDASQGDTGLPLITSEITINGNGSVIARSSPSTFRLIWVTASGSLTVNALTLKNGLTSSYSAYRNGGAILNEGMLTVNSSAIVGNTAINGGGAIYNIAQLTINNSTLSGNTALAGAAIYSTGADLISGSTIAANIAESGPLGGAIFGEAVGTHTLRNTIVANNVQGNCLGSFVDGGGNLYYPAGDLCPGVAADPKLGPLQLNAPGLTPTYALMIGSGALQGGVPSLCLEKDQRGVDRPLPANTTCDIGAYESSLLPPNPDDNTPPVITPIITGTLGNNGWYKSDVIVRWTVIDNESNILSSSCDSVVISTNTKGQPVSCSATSEGGTADSSFTIKRDVTGPSLSPSVLPNPVFLGGSATASANASDSHSGIASQSCGVVNASSLGNKAVACTATDSAGNTSNANADYRVIYNFAFVDTADPTNNFFDAKAGGDVQIKFTLGGNQGLGIFTASPTSLVTECPTTPKPPKKDPPKKDPPKKDPPEPVDDTDQKSETLKYDAKKGVYTYKWKTDKTWANTCRVLQLRLNDGTLHEAYFILKK